MKTSYKYLAIALATLLCSCNKELAPDTIESQVHISAQIIPTAVTRVTDDGTAFSNGDATKVQNMNRGNQQILSMPGIRLRLHMLHFQFLLISLREQQRQIG